MDKKPSFYRRQYLVDKKLQFRIAMAMVIEVALITLVLSLILLYVNDYYLGLITYFIGTSEAQQISLSDISRGIKWFLVGGVSVSSLIFAIIGIFVSHKIAGPIYRLKKNMIQVRNGIYNREIRFRKDDQLHDMADVFNEMSMALEVRKEITALYVERLEEITEDALNSLSDNSSNEDTRKQLGEISTIVKSIKENNSFVYDGDSYLPIERPHSKPAETQSESQQDNLKKRNNIIYLS